MIFSSTALCYGDTCEKGNARQTKKDAPRQRESGIHGGQRTGAVSKVLYHVMWVLLSNLKLEVVLFPDQK